MGENMADKTYYETLGVSKTASADELKSAYRRLAKQYHPDLYAGKPEAEKKDAEEKFKEINHAYSVLSDPQQRAAYDQYGNENGPQGFGGKTTALAVNIEYFPTHIAGLPVAVNINCHVTRHKTEVI